MTAEEFIHQKDVSGTGFKPSELEKLLVEFAKYHVEQALKEASNKALIEYGLDEETEEPILGNPIYDSDYQSSNFDSYPTFTVHKDSILKAYPLDLII